MTVDASEAVKVVVRCRPMNERELTNGYEKCVNVDVGSQSILLKNPKQRSNEDPRVFTFDCVYDENSTQRELYEKTFQNLVQSVLDGFNGTIFAYGQTGTGKTFTIQGVENDPELQGVMPNSFAQIFRHIAESKGSQYLVRASYLEIYKEEVRDLLQRDQSRNLEIKERPDSGIYVKDLSSVLTKNIAEIQKAMSIGHRNRAVGATNMNEHSSRSHAIFIVTVECCKTEANGQNHIRVGKLNLVDLAGSERQSKTLSEGERLKEATKINLSLSTLGNVISALVDGKSTHIPYRDSKLTRLLQDSLGGNAKTVMVANIGPATYNYEETLNTLRYAYRAKSIKNKPRINEDPKDALIREYQNEIERLKALLRSRSENIPRTISKTEKSKKSKRRNGADNSRDIESEAASLESYMKEQQAKLDAEKMAIMNDHSLVSEEKDRLLSELQSKEQKLQEERAQTTDLENKLKEMEGKLLVGGQSIIEHTRMQEFTLAQQRSKMAEHQRREQEIVAKMEETEGNMMNLQEGFSSLKQEVESNTRKLKKLYNKLQEVKQETMDLYERNNAERQEHEQMLEDLTREVKLRLLILENFVPVEERCNYEKRCYLDEEMEQWHVRPLVPSVEETGDTNGIIVPDDHLDPSLRSDLNSRHLKDSLFYGISESDVTTSRHDERLLVLDLDLPNRTTRDYEPPQLAPQVVAALEAALQDEEDLELDGSPSVFRSIPVKSRRKSKKLKIPMQKSDAEIFPMSRGLVPK